MTVNIYCTSYCPALQYTSHITILLKHCCMGSMHENVQSYFQLIKMDVISELLCSLIPKPKIGSGDMQ